MAYNQGLADRIRAEIGKIPGITEKKMFGGIGFMARGNMACGVHGDNLIVRVGEQNYETALNRPHTRPFDMTGRPMVGWIEVEPPGYNQDTELQGWTAQGVEYAFSLPAK